MSIHEIELISFRNHGHIKVTFRPGLNVIWGENGSGKTSLLEAVYLLSMGRSFRTPDRRQMIQWNKDYFQISGTYGKGNDIRKITMNQLGDGRRKIKVNDVVLPNIRQLIGHNPTVLLSPEEQMITKGGHGERRQFFDKLFAVASAEYFQELTEFNRILKQRNAALMRVRDREASAGSIQPWNQPLAEAGLRIWGLRRAFWADYRKHLRETTEKFNDASVSLDGDYPEQNTGSAEELENQLRKHERRDIALGRTMLGPQRDEYTFLYGGEDLRKFGSQGEHKLALILIKIAELRFVQQYNANPPLIILDDVFAKLDFQRSQYVMALLEKNIQTLITTTNLVNVESHGVDMQNANNMGLYLERPCAS